jgi:hypothetical protein
VGPGDRPRRGVVDRARGEAPRPSPSLD